MQYRNLGNSPLSVSQISLGTWKNIYPGSDLNLLKGVYLQGIEAGINLLDTSNNYEAGFAEKFTGDLAREVGRGNIYIATKCFFPVPEAGIVKGLSKASILKSIDFSLKNLGTDYIDLLQCHRWDTETSIEETADCMDGLVKQGKLRYWGLGAATAAQVVEAVLTAKMGSKSTPVAHQHIYHMFNRTAEMNLCKTGDAFGLGMLVYSPLAQGVLSGKYSGAIPKGSRAELEENRKTMWEFHPENLKKAIALQVLAAEYRMSVSAMAIAWLLRNKNVSSVICGIRSKEQLLQNLTAIDAQIDQVLIEKIENILQNKPLIPYTKQPYN